jgi:hypothetical protein
LPNVPFAETVEFVLGRSGRLAAIAIVLGAAFGTASHTARAASDLGGYDLSARAPALELVLDSDTVPVPAHPVLDATVPEASSALQTGFGHGLASLLWPGDLAGHFGSAVQQLGQLCTSLIPIAVPNLPTQCTPVPQSLKDNAAALNDPVKAETFAPGGPADAEYNFTPPAPGVVMKSHADANKVESTAGFASFGAPGLGTLGSITSHSITTADGPTAISQAKSELFDVALAGGLVTIDHIQSTAKEATDGQQAGGTGQTVVSGLRIGGVPASVDSNGLQLGTLSAAANQALHSLGLEIKLTAPNVLSDGAKGSFAAPLLTISYRDDQNALEAAATALGQQLTTGSLQQVTGSLRQLALGPQAKVTLSMGGAAVAVDAAPAFSSASDSVGGASVGSEGGQAITTPGTPGSTSPAVEGLSFSSQATPAVSRNVPARAVSRPAGFFGGFGGLAWGLVLACVAAALAFAYGLYRYALAADAAGVGAAAGACPYDSLH